MISKINNTIFKFVNRLYFLYKGVGFSKNLIILGLMSVKLKKGGKLTIGENFTCISGSMKNSIGRNLKSSFRVDENASLTIANNVGMSNVAIWTKTKVIIGNYVKLGSGVIIIDSDMHSLNYKTRRDVSKDALEAKSKPITIADDVFIGTNSIITKGVSIGEKAIVAAGSVVVKSIPSYEVWGGNPAVLIKKIKND